MKKRSTIIAALLLLTIWCHAQDLVFRVLSAKGNVHVKENGHWGALRVGGKIMSGSEIKISAHSYAGLIHTSGKPVEVMKPGTYKVADLVKTMQNEKSVMEKYTAFIFATEKQGRNRLSATGAVHRGNEDVTVFLPSETVNVLGSSFQIFWRARHHSESFDVVVSDMFGNELFTKRVSEQSILVDLDSEGFAGKGILSIKIHSVDHPGSASDNYYINRVSGEEKEILEERYAELTGVFSEKTFLACLLESAFFEENNLPVEAIMAIHGPERPNEQSELFATEYHDLLRRYGIKHE